MWAFLMHIVQTFRLLKSGVLFLANIITANVVDVNSCTNHLNTPLLSFSSTGSITAVYTLDLLVNSHQPWL